jgi:DNA repair protein RadD
VVITLRTYQSDAVNGIRRAYREGKRAPLLVLPTGGGKTVTFSYVTQSAAAKGRCVYLLVHRAELVKQIAGTLARFGCTHNIIAPGPIVRQCQADQFRAHGRTYVQPGARVFVASVQTLVKRLDKIPTDMAPDLIVIDEAHHLTAGTMWGTVVEKFPKAYLLPVTATPCRLDGKGLGLGAGGFCDELIMGPTMRELIEAGALSPYRIFAPPNALDLSGVKTRAGDYAKDQLATAVDKPMITGDVVQHYHRLAAGRRALVFCVSVEHARHVASEFAASGVESEFLDGTLDASEREAIIKRFEAGTTMVLTSCDLVSEGFDCPAIEAAILLRPTQSLSLYLQQVGRALRMFPGKTEAIILDHVGAVQTHGLPDEDREWSLDGVKRGKRQAANDNEPGVDRVSTCPKCFTIHLPAAECPTCGHVYPIKARQLEQADGELQEITGDQLEAMRRQRRAMQGKAETVEDLVHKLGMSRGRAQKIVQARQAKAQQIEAIMDGLDRIKLETGQGPFAALGVTLGDIRRMKPKELTALNDRVASVLKVPA